MSIHKRSDVATREEVGHWEADTMVGPQDTRASILTVVERTSRFLVAVVLTDRHAATVAKALTVQLRKRAEEASLPVLSITTDNGKEFAEHRRIAQALQCAVTFADPKSPHQRGTNENTNGLIRELIPKSRCLTSVGPRDLEWIVERINTRPRKCLKYLSSEQFARTRLPISHGDFGVAM